MLLAITNKAAMNIVEHVSLLHVGASFGYMPRSGIAGNPITKEHTCYALTDKWILVQKLGIPKIQFINQIKLKSLSPNLIPEEGRDLHLLWPSSYHVTTHPM